MPVPTRFALSLLAGLAGVTAAQAQPAPAAAPPPPRAVPLPPAFTRQPERIPQPPPPALAPEVRRRLPGDDTPLSATRIAPGYDLRTDMRELGSSRATCRLGFTIANIGTRAFQTITINLAATLAAGGPAKTFDLPLVDTLEPDHSVVTQTELPSPCTAIKDVRLRGFSRCTIDDVSLGTCRPPMLMRSTSRIFFGL